MSAAVNHDLSSDNSIDRRVPALQFHLIGCVGIKFQRFANRQNAGAMKSRRKERSRAAAGSDGYRASRSAGAAKRAPIDQDRTAAGRGIPFRSKEERSLVD